MTTFCKLLPNGTMVDVQEIPQSAMQRCPHFIMVAERRVTPETAAALGEAFGTGAQFWLNLETQYQLWKRRPDVDGARR